MIDQKSKSHSKVADESARPAPLSRRTLLKAGATAMPVVLTLQSGAALARSSNLIGPAPGSRNTEGNALCLDTSTADPVDGKYDLRDPGYATVNVIPDVEYYPLDSGRSVSPTTADTFCNAGGSMQHHAGGWHQVDLPTDGIIVSANSFSSVSANVDIALRDWT